MWLTDLRHLTRLATSVADVCSLLRENNALLRELIQVVSQRPAQTPPSAQRTPSPTFAPRRPIGPPRTDKDVFRVTRATLIDQAINQQRKQFPHVPLQKGPPEYPDPEMLLDRPLTPLISSSPPSPVTNGPDQTASATVAPKTASSSDQ